MVSAYITPGGYRLLLLHESRNEEGIRAFFQEAHELLLKVRFTLARGSNGSIHRQSKAAKLSLRLSC